MQAVLEAGVLSYFPWQFGVDYNAIGKGSSQELFDEMLRLEQHAPDHRLYLYRTIVSIPGSS